MRRMALILAAVLFFTTACSNTPDLAGEWKMGGPYNVGKPCRIIQNGNALTFVNENGDKSSGVLQDNTTVIATDWEGGLQGLLVNGATRITWKNGTWWLREK